MVSANDNHRGPHLRSRQSGAEDLVPASNASIGSHAASGSVAASGPASGFPVRDRGSVEPASDSEASPSNDLGATLDRPRPVTYTRVTDDFGDHLEIRIGEAVLLGPLIDSVIEKLSAKRANER
jgi:hypothetical protein